MLQPLQPTPRGALESLDFSKETAASVWTSTGKSFGYSCWIMELLGISFVLEVLQRYYWDTNGAVNRVRLGTSVPGHVFLQHKDAVSIKRGGGHGAPAPCPAWNKNWSEWSTQFTLRRCGFPAFGCTWQKGSYSVGSFYSSKSSIPFHVVPFFFFFSPFQGTIWSSGDFSKYALEKLNPCPSPGFRGVSFDQNVHFPVSPSSRVRPVGESPRLAWAGLHSAPGASLIV